MAQSKPTPAARRSMDARQGVARQDMALGLSPLVKPIIRGKRVWLEGIKQSWNGGLLELAGPELDAGDLGVLLALLALALRNTGEQRLEPGLAVQGMLPKSGGKPNSAGDKDVLPLQTTLAAICREIGRDTEDGRAHAAIRASIKRLQGVVIEARSGDAWASTHLIAGAAGRGKGAVSVALNYRLTRAVLGTASYGRIRMSVWRRLSPVGQCLYHWLACWRPGYGTCPPIWLDTLSRHVWGAEAAGATLRDRRRMLLAALSELPSDEWTVQIHGKSARIERKNIDAQVGPEPLFLPTPGEEPVFLPTPTRVFAHAPQNEKGPCIKLLHEM